MSTNNQFENSVKPKKILFYLCGDRNKASSRVRGYWIAEALEAQGMVCSMEHRHSISALFSFFFSLLFYDVIIFQKTYSKWHCLLLRWAKILGKTTILDLDDAPSRINNPVTLHNVEFMMRHISAITVGSQVLFDYANQFSEDVYLIPSCINLKYYQPGAKKQNLDKPICLGWIGNGKHYKQDLITLLKEPLTQIAKRFSIRFKLIGACGDRALYSAFENIPGLELDIVNQIEWSNPHAVSQALKDIDVGLYPLLPNEFNQYKCGFKALEYMAMRIPVISSNVAENRKIIEHGKTGLFAKSKQDWVEHIEYLLNNDESIRAAIGHQGREKVEQSYSVTGAAEKILALLEKLD